MEQRLLIYQIIVVASCVAWVVMRRQISPLYNQTRSEILQVHFKQLLMEQTLPVRLVWFQPAIPTLGTALVGCNELMILAQVRLFQPLRKIDLSTTQ